MTAPEEQAAEVLAAHRGLDLCVVGGRWVAQCECGESAARDYADSDDWHRTHIAAALAPLFAEERRKAAEAAWREGSIATSDYIAAEPRPGGNLSDLNPYREQAATYAEGGEHRG